MQSSAFFLLMVACLVGTPHTSAAQTTENLQSNGVDKRSAKELPADDYRSTTIAGWTVHVSRQLQRDEPQAVAKTLELLQGQLEELVRVVPAGPVKHLRTVPIWISPKPPATRPRAEYHPSAQWLREHGRNIAAARAVECTNALTFERACRRMPMLMLHELAHAYHDQVLGFNEPRIKAAYDKAVASRKYDAVEQRQVVGEPGKVVRAYAMTNPNEYFAELTESFFGTNDFFPFTHDELRRHDPEMFELLDRIWHERD